MIYSAKEILKKYNDANSIKSTWDTEYRKVFEYCMPSRDQYQKATGAGETIDPNAQDRRAKLYSSVGEQCAAEFVNTMQEVLCPPMANWISLEAGSKFAPEDKKKVNPELQKICDIANEYKNNSSFDVAFSEFCYDVFAGTGCLLVLPGTPINPLVFRAIPIREYCLEEGANGEVCAVYRSYALKRELVKYQWKELKGEKGLGGDQNKDVNILECTYYDKDLYTYHYVVINRDAQSELVHREYRTNPFIVLRWNKCAGEPYGRGVGLTAINDIKTLNLIKEYSLRNFAFNIPPLLVREDAMLDVDSLELTPFSLNVVPDTQNSIVPLQISTDHNIESYKVQELTMEIKRNTFGNTLPNEGNRELTATEINARQAELRRSLNSVFGRLINEFQLPLVQRIVDVLTDTKAIIVPKNPDGSPKFDVSEIDGLIYKIKVNTPIARQLAAGEAQAIIGAIGLVSQLDPSGSMLGALLKVNDIGSHLMNLLGVPPQFVNTAEEVGQIQQQQAQGQAQAQQAAMQANVDAESAIASNKEMAKVQASEAMRGA